MNQYLDELYGWIASQDPTFKSRYPNQDDWNEKMQDPEYAKKMHSWISSVDDTFAIRRPVDMFLESVKKKDSTDLDGAGEVVSTDPTTSRDQEPISSESQLSPLMTRFNTSLDEFKGSTRGMVYMTQQEREDRGLEGINWFKEAEGYFSDKQEEEAVMELNARFGQYGFKFEEAVPGMDFIYATAPNGETMYFEIDLGYGTNPYGQDRPYYVARKESIRKAKDEKLFSFIGENMVDDEFKVETIAMANGVNRHRVTIPNEREAQQRIDMSNEMMLTITERQLALDAKYEEYEELNSLISLEPSEEARRNELAEELRVEIPKHNQHVQDFNGSLETLEYDLGAFTQLKAQQGSRLEYFYNKLLKGIDNIAMGIGEIGVDVYTEFAYQKFISAQQYVDELRKQPGFEDFEVPDEFIIEEGSKVSPYKGIGVTSTDLNYLTFVAQPENYEGSIVDGKIVRYGRLRDYIYKQTFKKKEDAGSFEYQFEDLDSQIMGTLLDPVRKRLKKPYIGSTPLTDFIGANITEEYINAMDETWITGSFGGAVESIPSFAGKRLRMVRLMLSTTAQLQEEMSGEEFADVKEGDKYKLIAPVAVATAVLENLGFRNLINKKGFVSMLVYKFLKKSPGGKFTAKSFAEFVEQDVKTMVGRGTLTMAGGFAAEAETGFLQEIVDINAKRMWNATYGVQFDTPEMFSAEYYSQVTEAAVREGIGSLLLGAPTVVRSATNPFSDRDMELLNMYKNTAVVDASIASINGKVAAGEITREEADEKIQQINDAAAAVNQMPENLSLSQQKQAYRLLQEEKQLKDKMKGKDERFFRKEAARIKEISKQLEALAEAAPEVTQQPEAAPATPSRSQQDISNRLAEITQEIEEIDALEVLTKEDINRKKNLEIEQEQLRLERTQAQPAPAETTQTAETQRDETVVDDVIDRPAQLSGFGGSQFDSPIDGDVYVEGQRVVFESKDGQIYDLGNIDDIRSDGVSSVNLIPQESLVQANEDGSLTVEGEKMNMQTELPTQGIEYNEDGSIKAVSLVDDSGNTKMYTGAVAEDLAYQILLNQIQTPEQEQRINEQLEQDEEFRQLREAQIRRSTTDKFQEPEGVAEEGPDQDTVETPAQPRETGQPEEAGPTQEVDLTASDAEAQINALDNVATPLKRAITGMLKRWKKDINKYKMKIVLLNSMQDFATLRDSNGNLVVNGAKEFLDSDGIIRGYHKDGVIYLPPWETTNMDGTTEFGSTKESVQEEFLHGVLRTIIGQDSVRRAPLFAQLSKLAKTSVNALNVLKEKLETYLPESLVIKAGKDKFHLNINGQEVDLTNLTEQKLRDLGLSEDKAKEVSEESIVGLLIDYSNSPEKYESGIVAKIRNFINKLFGKFKGDVVIKNNDDLLALAKKIKDSRQFEKAVSVEQSDLNSAINEDTKAEEAEGRGAFSAKQQKVFNDMKDGVKLYYTQVASVGYNEFTGEDKMSYRDLTMDVPSYFYFKAAYNNSTGNGVAPDRMRDMYYFDSDGNRVDVAPPRPKVDNAGNVIEMSVPKIKTYGQRLIEKRLREQELRDEVRKQIRDLDSELFELLSNNDKNLSSHTQVDSFSPIQRDEFDVPSFASTTVEDEMEKLQELIITKANIKALIESDITEEDLIALKGRGSIVSRLQHPSIFTMSNLEIIGPSEIDTTPQNIAELGMESNPDAEGGRFAKSRVTREGIKRRKLDALNEKGELEYPDLKIQVNSYKSKPKEFTKETWKNVSDRFKRGRVLHVGWDQVAAANFRFKGNPNTYSTSSGIEELSIAGKEGKSVSFHNAAMQRQFEKKLVENGMTDGKIHVVVTLNGAKARNLAGNPLLFSAIMDNVLYQADQGNLGKKDVVDKANEAFNDRRTDRSRSTFESILRSPESSQFEELIVRNEDGSFAWKDYRSFKKGYDLFMNIDGKTLGMYQRVGEKFIAIGWAGPRGLPTLQDIRNSLILPEYMDGTDAPEAGTVAAVLEIDLGEMKSKVGDGFKKRIDKGSAFPYAFEGGLKEVVVVTDKPLAQDVFRSSTMPVTQMGPGVTVRATPGVVGTGIGYVTEQDMIIGVNGRFSRSRKGTKTVNTNQGTFEVPETSFWQSTRDLWIIRLQEKYQGVFNIQKAVAGSKPNFRVSDEENFFMSEKTMYGKAALDLENIEKEVDRLAKTLKENGITSEELGDYMYNLHAEERNNVIRERNGSESGSGRTTDAAKKALAAIPAAKRKSLEAAADIVRDMMKKSRQTMVEFGLESQETIDIWESMFENYVPLQGFADATISDLLGDKLPPESGRRYGTGGAGIAVTGQTTKKAKGRKTEAANIIPQIIANATSRIIKARSNEAMQALYNLVSNNPNSKVWRVIDSPGVGNNPNISDAHMVGVRINGKQVGIYFEDASNAEVLKGMGLAQQSWITKVPFVGSITRYLRRSFTTLNPEFIISNFARDIQSAIFNASAEADIEGGLLNSQRTVKEIMRLVFPATKALVKGQFGGKMDPLIERYYQEFQEDGGRTGWAYNKSLQKIAQELEAKSTDKTSWQEILGKGNNALEFIEGVNDAFENGIRLSAYIAAREAGMSRSKAAMLAKTITVNFNAHGTWGQALNSVYLFFNASVQGTARLGRSLLGSKPVQAPDGSDRNWWQRRTGAQKMAAGMVVFNAMLAAINIGISDEDEDGELFYNKIPDYIKERNMIIMMPFGTGAGRDYWKIPLPYGYNIFANLGTVMTEVSSGDREIDSALWFLANSTLSSFSPISGGQSKDLSTYVAKAIAPSPIKPLVEMAVNETYFGNKIELEPLPFGVKKPDSHMSFRSPESVKDFFQWVNEATGGSEYREGAIDVNPDKVWYLFEYMMGGAANFVIRSGETTYKLFQPGVELQYNDIPFLRKLYGEPSKYYDYELYKDNTLEVGQLAKEMKEAPRLGDTQRYKGIPLLNKLMKTYEKRLKKIRKQKKEARQIKNFRERTIRMQELMDQERRILMEFNQKYEQYRD